jgi:hypothetical protein
VCDQWLWLIRLSEFVKRRGHENKETSRVTRPLRKHTPYIKCYLNSSCWPVSICTIWSAYMTLIIYIYTRIDAVHYFRKISLDDKPFFSQNCQRVIVYNGNITRSIRVIITNKSYFKILLLSLKLLWVRWCEF